MDIIQKVINTELQYLYEDIKYVNSEDLFKFQNDFDNATTEKEKVIACYNAYLKYDIVDEKVMRIWVAYGIIDNMQKNIMIDLMNI